FCASSPTHCNKMLTTKFAESVTGTSLKSTHFKNTGKQSHHHHPLRFWPKFCAYFEQNCNKASPFFRPVHYFPINIAREKKLNFCRLVAPIKILCKQFGE